MKAHTLTDECIHTARFHVLVCTAQTTKSMKTNDIPLKSPIKLQQEMQKKILNFPKFVRFLGHLLKKHCFWKMGMAGIKRGPRPLTIPSFLVNLNEEALLKICISGGNFIVLFNGILFVFILLVVWAVQTKR